MTCTPREWCYSSIDIVTAIATYLKDACHVETRTRVRVILNDDILLVSLDTGCNLTESLRTADTCHIFQTDLICTCIDELLCKVYIIFYCVDWRVSDTK